MRVQILDTDYTVLNNKPLIRIFGKSESGETVCIFYDKYYPYFYVHSKQQNFAKIVEALKTKHPEISAEVVDKFLPTGYGPLQKVLKITGKDPSTVPEMKQMVSRLGTPYEADILFKYRFMADFGLKGMGWCEVEGKPVKTDTVKVRTIHADKITSIEPVENMRLNYLALDIETVGKENEFLEPGAAEIIMVSLTFSPNWKEKEKVVLMSKPTRIPGVIGTENEKAMLEKLLAIIHDYDPDIISGYNINNFDLPHLIERMKFYNIKPDFSRSSKPALIRKFQGTTAITISGRIVVDPYEIIKKDVWLRFKRYDLRTIAKEMLSIEKLDIGGPQQIAEYWKDNGNAGGKLQKLVEYSQRDSDLVMKLLQERKILDKFFELAKVSGVLLQDTLGGQSQRLEFKLLNEFNHRNFLMPCKPESIDMGRRKIEREKSGLKGAIVLEPEVGLHTGGCVIVLDFTSLYPSIINSFNICPTTVLKSDEKVAYHTSPDGSRFVDKSVREGILPSVVYNLINTRAAVKKQLRIENDPFKKRILNAKQLALKDMANSLYGYTGYIRSRLYIMDVASAITAYGRDNIMKTKDIVEKDYKLKVLYGDTDSIFLQTETADVDRAQKLGEKIAADVTQKLPGLKFSVDKIFKSFLILAKKRYAGWLFEKNSKGSWKEKIEMKGIETVRRDWCELTTETMNEVLRIILKEQDAKKAAQYTRGVVKDLASGNIPLEKLTVIKGISKRVEAYDGMLPHVELARKIKSRDPARGSMVGERLGYVIIKGNDLLSKRAEDPAYVKENNLEIDSQYYIENQLLPPLERIFEVMNVSKLEIVEGKKQLSLAGMLQNGNGSNKILSPDQTVLDKWDSIVCRKCNWHSIRPSLSGNCPKCGDQIYFSHAGSIGKFVKVPQRTV